MIVGCKNIDFTALKRACANEETLAKFAYNIVPTPLQHLQEVLDNQKYLVALQVRSIQSMPWKRRKQLCESLLKGARIKGVPDAFYDYTDILLSIDCDAFSRYLEEEDRDAP